MAATLLVVPTAGAGTINVTTTVDSYGGSGANCSLREAVTAAQTDSPYDGCAAGSGADVIAIPSGEYKVTRAGDDEDSNATGDIDITGTGALTIQPTGSNAKVVLNGNSLDRVIDQRGNSSLSIRNLQVKGGKITEIEDGGGIRNNVGTLTLEGVTVSGNSSSYSGGGISVYGILNVVNSTLSANSADGSGGGLYVTGGAAATIKSSTITGNFADADTLVNGDGGGFRSAASTVTLVNTINAGNQDLSALPADRSPDCSSDPNFFPRYVLTTQAMGPSPCLVGFNPGTSQVVTDARLGPLKDNGGQTPTHALLADSPAIGAGGLNGSADECPTADQAGRARNPQSCDIGAVQYNKPVPPKTVVKITRVKPKMLRLKRGRSAKTISVTVSALGGKTATNAKLCLRLNSQTRKSLKLKGKSCRKLGKLAGAKTVKFKVAARNSARKKTFKLKAVLGAAGATTKTRSIKVRVK